MLAKMYTTKDTRLSRSLSNLFQFSTHLYSKYINICQVQVKTYEHVFGQEEYFKIYRL